MAPLQQEFVYTNPGPQRPVLLPDGAVVRFSLTMQAGDSGRIETTCDPHAQVGHGQAQWEPYAGGMAGGVAQITALRAVLGRTSGWAQLTVQQGE